MKKRLTKILAASALFAGLLAGCSGGGGNTSEGGSTSDGDTIKIGANFELSGTVASYGESNLKGVELAVEEINANGGIDGKQIELIKIDNKSDNAEAVMWPPAHKPGKCSGNHRSSYKRTDNRTGTNCQ